MNCFSQFKFWVFGFFALRVIAMTLVWKYGEKPGNESWKGLSWGMVSLSFELLCFKFSNVMIQAVNYSVPVILLYT